MFEVPIQRDGESPQLTDDDHGDDRDPRVERRCALGIAFVTGSRAGARVRDGWKPARASDDYPTEVTSTMPTA